MDSVARIGADAADADVAGLALEAILNWDGNTVAKAACGRRRALLGGVETNNAFTRIYFVRKDHFVCIP